MNKESEIEIFSQVYGSRLPSKVEESEAPDFLVSHPEGITLGIEVTEVYTDQTDARLKHHKGYLGGLLEGTQPVFRADTNKIDVDEITIVKGDGSGEVPTTAVIRTVPPWKERIKLVESAILDKEKKLPSYLTKCESADLIIHDSTGLFFHQEFDDFHKSFFCSVDVNLLRYSGFREIFLIFSLLNNQRIYTPLRINAFLSDLYAFQGIVVENIENEDEHYPFIFLSMYLIGHRDFSVITTSSKISIHYGGWCFEHDAKTTNICDLTNDLRQKDVGEHICKIVQSMTDEQHETARRHIAERKNILDTLPVYFPIELHNQNIDPTRKTPVESGQV